MKKKKKCLILITILLLGLLSIRAVTFAKYVYNSVWNYYLESKGFYFSSDDLDTTEVKNVNNLWDGESVSFNIKNNLNNTVISDYDIEYRVICTVEGEASNYTECHLNDTSSNTVTGTLSKFEVCVNDTNDGVDVDRLSKTDCELNNYKWTKQIASKNISFNIVTTDNNYVIKDVNVSIDVASTAPYSKTLLGKFILHKGIIEEKLDVKYNNYSNYDRLLLTNTTSISKCVSISWDTNKLLIDGKQDDFISPSVDQNGYINQITARINPNSSLNYIFYRKDFSNNFTVDEFTVNDTSGC